MAVSIIEQTPTNTTFPAGQDSVFVVSNQTAVATEVRVKFGVEVHISKGDIPNVGLTDDLIGIFKTTPNNAGVGIFNFKNILENYVSADHLAFDNALFMGFPANSFGAPLPLHCIDKWSRNINTFSNVKFQFFVEYLGADATLPNIVSRANGTSVNSGLFKVFNGYLKYTNPLTQIFNGLGTNFFAENFTIGDVFNSRFLTNAPRTEQRCFVNDYMTQSIFIPAPGKQQICRRIQYFITKNDGTTATINLDMSGSNGGYPYGVGLNESQQYLVFFGIGPANLQQASTTFATMVTDGEIEGGKIEYRIMADQVTPGTYVPITKTYTLFIDCPNAKRFEPIRLCWLNQYGSWDYYTFNMKSTRTISSKATTYHQLQGTWNESLFNIEGNSGGVKTFNKNSVEKIRINTDYVSEEFVTMFEEFMVSPETYLLKEKTSSTAPATIAQQVMPIRLTSSSFKKKTTVNDRLIQYTFDIELSRKLNTQTI
ncbi:MAG: hypothetical protein Unbinned6316contig1000_4 [Prokaryotic dsDNA virus sp.]|nr:MAG: hypothetical protein Unbinned6316contig1000_4 [Prokaryotic dsDNA virus sp.]|tara:strand:- start:4199 stop:5647 length:1449 start_codon:yes stop_codon:yes gene_type:complete